MSRTRSAPNLPDSPQIPLMLQVLAAPAPARNHGVLPRRALLPHLHYNPYKKVLKSRPVGKEVHAFFEQQRALERKSNQGGTSGGAINQPRLKDHLSPQIFHDLYFKVHEKNQWVGI
ncbi:hypothetical protein MRX96_056620 [Rhipicephalus microplus]